MEILQQRSLLQISKRPLLSLLEFQTWHLSPANNSGRIPIVGLDQSLAFLPYHPAATLLAALTTLLTGLPSVLEHPSSEGLSDVVPLDRTETRYHRTCNLHITL